MDDLVTKRVVDALKAGMGRKAAAGASGIGWSTLKVWLAAGRRGEAPYAAFLAKVEEAEGKAEREVVDALMTAIKAGKVDAIKLWLTSRRPQEWAQREGVANDSDDDADNASIDADESFTRSVLAAIQSRKVGT